MNSWQGCLGSIRESSTVSFKVSFWAADPRERNQLFALLHDTPILCVALPAISDIQSKSGFK